MPTQSTKQFKAAEQAAQEAREAAERQFIGDILADDNSDYDIESPRGSQDSKSHDPEEDVKSEPGSPFLSLPIVNVNIAAEPKWKAACKQEEQKRPQSSSSES